MQDLFLPMPRPSLHGGTMAFEPLQNSCGSHLGADDCPACTFLAKYGQVRVDPENMPSNPKIGVPLRGPPRRGLEFARFDTTPGVLEACTIRLNTLLDNIRKLSRAVYKRSVPITCNQG